MERRRYGVAERRRRAAGVARVTERGSVVCAQRATAPDAARRQLRHRRPGIPRRRYCASTMGRPRSALIGIALAAVAHADPVPAGATWSEAYFPSGDGTRLHADILRPRGPQGAPPWPW